jgi:hypothetical protein
MLKAFRLYSESKLYASRDRYSPSEENTNCSVLVLSGRYGLLHPSEPLRATNNTHTHLGRTTR